MKCKNCKNEINNNMKFCPVCGKSINQNKNISAVSILSIIMFVLSVIASSVMIISYIADAPDSSEGIVHGYTLGLVIIGILGIGMAGYYMIVMIISLILEHKTKSKRAKNICISIALSAPFIFAAFVFLVVFISDRQRAFTIKNLKVEFSKDMKLTGTSMDFDGKYKELTFYTREEEHATCSIAVLYGDYDNTISAIKNMQKISSDDFIDKDLTLYDFLDSSSYTNKMQIAGKTWDYLNYQKNAQKYYKIYGTSYKENYYVIKVSDNHSNHSMCQRKELEFINKIRFK